MMVSYTDFVPSTQTRYRIGWVQIGMASFNMIVNCILMLVTIPRQVLKRLRQNYAIKSFKRSIQLARRLTGTINELGDTRLKVKQAYSR